MLIDVRVDRELYPFESRWFDSSVGRIHYVDEGEGPTLLLCHGSPTWSFYYRRVIADLRDGFRCVAMDLPGFGLSVRPDRFGYRTAEHIAVVGELVDHLDLDGFIVVGHDWGGSHGLGVAVDRSDRVAGIALMNTALWPIDAWPNRAFSAVMSSAPLRRRIVSRNLLVERFVIGQLADVLTPEEADHYRRVQPSPAARVALAAMPGEIRAARPLLSELEAKIPRTLGDKPVVVVWGMRDPVFRARACLPRIGSAFDDLEVVELPDVSHFVAEQAPREVAAAIRRRFS